MRNLLKSLIVVAVAVPALASAVVVGSKHDFSVNGGSTFKATTETQVCKFCHAPHAATSQKLIWSKATSTVTGWAAASTTQSGTILPTAIQPGSRLCLSCHDGVLSVGAMGTNPPIAGAGLGTPLTGLLRVAFTGDHPVSVKYPGTTGTYFGNSNGSGTLVAEYKTITPASGVKLFTDPAAGGASGIECGSCHDVHNNAPAGNGFFLLAPQAGSGICLACHTK